MRGKPIQPVSGEDGASLTGRFHFPLPRRGRSFVSPGFGTRLRTTSARSAPMPVDEIVAERIRLGRRGEKEISPMKQWEMGRSQTPLPPERLAEVPWLFIRQQTGIGVLVCCTIPSSSRPLSENDEAEIKSARERLARLHESGDLPAGAAWFWPRSDRRPEPISPEPRWLQAQTARHRVFQVRMR